MSSPPRSDGRSEVYRRFEEELERVAKSDVTVLVEGEPGSGKTRAARALHAASPRSAGPLVEVDLAALSPSLIEAELFGHEEGAYTGAHRARRGRFRRADGGTLVLEDIGGLAPELQVKLLRVLQERSVEPLGAERAVECDVRVVATCAANLGAEVRAKRFREDLYYRLAVVVVRVPPLRVRTAEMGALMESIAAEVARRAGVPPRTLTPGAVERLKAHPWPGNVRELENALERVTVLGSPDTGPGPHPVEPEELGFLDEALDGAARRLAREALAHGLTLDALALATLEWALVEQRGNLSAAARMVGLSRRAFEYRLDKLRGSQGAEPGSRVQGAEKGTGT